MFYLLVPLVLAGSFPLFFMDLGLDPVGPMAQLNIFGHFAFFALLSWYLSSLPYMAGIHICRQILWVLLAVLFLGGAIELIQGYLGRTPAWKDLGVNLLGGLFGLLFFASGRARIPGFLLKSGQVMVLALCFFMFYGPVVTLWDMHMAARQFPVLSSFETRFESKRWIGGEIDHELSRIGSASLRVELRPQRYSGTTFWRSFGNWEGYEVFSLSIHNPEPDPLDMTISISDREHSVKRGGFHDRFNRELTLEKGWNDIRIQVSEIENAPAQRSMDLSRLSYVVIFAMDLSEPRTIYLDDVRLIP